MIKEYSKSMMCIDDRSMSDVEQELRYSLALEIMKHMVVESCVVDGIRVMRVKLQIDLGEK